MRLIRFLSLVAWGVWALPSVARAGGAGTGGGSDTGGGADTAAETGTAGDGTGGSTGGGADSGSCGTCEEPSAPIVFVSPLDGQEVPADLMATIEVNHACSCDDCGCYEDNPASFTLSVDGAEVFACFDGCTRTFVEDLSLAPGTHQLTAAAEYSFHTETVTITVTVAGNGATEGGATEGGATEGTGEGGDGSDGGKGGCRVGEPAHGSPLALGAWLLALGVVRRRVRAR